MTSTSSSVTQSLGTRLVGKLREMILTGELEPGEVLVEPRLAERFAISKTPVREALHVLATEGLVTVLPKKGYLVRTMTPQDLAEVLDLRMLLEPHAAAEAARFADMDAVARLRTILERQREEAGVDPLAAMREAHAFHQVVAQTARNARLVSQLQHHLDETSRAHHVIPSLRAYMGVPGELREHEVILKAISTGDSAGARQAMRTHLHTIRTVTSRHLDRGSALWTETNVRASTG